MINLDKIYWLRVDSLNDACGKPISLELKSIAEIQNFEFWNHQNVKLTVWEEFDQIKLQSQIDIKCKNSTALIHFKTGVYECEIRNVKIWCNLI